MTSMGFAFTSFQAPISSSLILQTNLTRMQYYHKSTLKCCWFWEKPYHPVMNQTSVRPSSKLTSTVFRFDIAKHPIRNKRNRSGLFFNVLRMKIIVEIQILAQLFVSLQTIILPHYFLLTLSFNIKIMRQYDGLQETKIASKIQISTMRIFMH